MITEEEVIELTNKVNDLLIRLSTENNNSADYCNSIVDYISALRGLWNTEGGNATTSKLLSEGEETKYVQKKLAADVRQLSSERVSYWIK